MSPELLHLIHKQKSVHRRVIKTKRRDVDLITHHRKLRNQVNNMYRRLENKYFQHQLQEYRKSSLHLWSAINHITGRHRQHHPSTAKLSDLIAHFRSPLFQPDQTNVLPSGPDNSTTFCEFSPVSSSQVEELIMDLGNDKAAGPDGILPSELKMVANKYLSHSLFSLTKPCPLALYLMNSKLAISSHYSNLARRIQPRL